MRLCDLKMKLKRNEYVGPIASPRHNARLTEESLILETFYVLTNIHTIMNSALVEKQIRKEDKAGLAYILNNLMGINSLGYSMYYTAYTKNELLQKVLSCQSLWNKLEKFKTYEKYFAN